MDTSSKYILMCEKAAEVQEGWKPKSGDWISHHGSDIGIHIYNGYRRSWNVYTGGGETEYHNLPEKLKQCTWLLRQDQLQAMINDPIEFAIEKFYCLQEFGDSFHNYTNNIDNRTYWYSMRTLEQLWLAFVMKEKYDKVWSTTKKDWIK